MSVRAEAPCCQALTRTSLRSGTQNVTKTSQPAPDAASILEVRLAEPRLEISLLATDDADVQRQDQRHEQREPPRQTERERRADERRHQRQVHRIAGDAKRARGHD